MMPKIYFLLAAALATTAQADLDPCMVGNWQASNDDVALMVERQVKGDTVVQAGNVMLNIESDGNYQLTALGLQLKIDTGDETETVTVTGSATGTLNFVDETWFSTIDNNLLENNAEGALAGHRFLGRALGSYFCTGNALRLESEPGRGPTNLPRAWDRTG